VIIKEDQLPPKVKSNAYQLKIQNEVHTALKESNLKMPKVLPVTRSLLEREKDAFAMTGFYEVTPFDVEYLRDLER